MAGLLSASLRNSRPNFVLFNVDDTGFGDWSWNLNGAAKHAASDDGRDDTPRTAALVRTPSGMHDRPALHTRSPLRSLARPIVRRLLAMSAPCHRTLPRTLPPLTDTDALGTPHRAFCSGRAASG